jgi:sn-1 stearoyl-lipid 9-desaturase
MSSRLRRRVNGLGLGAIHAVALAAFIPGTFEWSAVAAAAVLLYLTCGLGIALCFHRTLTHRGLRLRKPLEYALSALGTLALQGDPIRWVATHRKHHAHSDAEGDPHRRDLGFRWAHVNWLYMRNDDLPTDEDLRHFAPDLYEDRFYRSLPYLQWPLHLGLAALLFAIGGWSWVIWGMSVRLAAGYHATWLVNSAAHSIGYRNYRTGDLSTNCWWVALISWGEGWHNNHHAFPYSARHGLRWFEIDPTWWLVRGLALLRLADRVQIPSNVALMRLKEAP